MITIANSRAEKYLNTTISEAVAVACERVLHEQDEAARGKRRRQQLDRVLADIRKRHKLTGTPEERARLADHRDLYGPDGLPR